jgi:P-type conjugative transfer protein TrbG
MTLQSAVAVALLLSLSRLAGADGPPSEQVPAAPTPAADTVATPTPAAPAEGAAAAAPAVPPAPASATDPESLARAYRATGAAPTVESPEATLFPYGKGRPLLHCAPLRACVIELEAAEVLLATSTGDSERWLVQTASSGPGARTPIVVVKPTACDLSTNLVISTDRRLYELGLESPPCRDADAGHGSYNPRLPYTGILRFYYPEELVQRWARAEELARLRSSESAAGGTPLSPSARLATLNFDYTWKGDRRYPWTPAHVFDDGEHTFIVLPPSARVEEAPALFTVQADGTTALLNYRYEHQTFIADRVVERAVLVVGTGRSQQKLEIINRARRRS